MSPTGGLALTSVAGRHVGTGGLFGTLLACFFECCHLINNAHRLCRCSLAEEDEPILFAASRGSAN